MERIPFPVILLLCCDGHEYLGRPKSELTLNYCLHINSSMRNLIVRKNSETSLGLNLHHKGDENVLVDVQ